LPVLQAKWKEEDGVTRYVYEHSATRCPVALHRTYDAWPFYASQDGIFQVFQDGKAQLYFASEEFKNDCDFMHRAYQAGLIHPDTLNQPQDEINLDKQNGDYLMGIMTGGEDVYDEDGVTVKYNYENIWLNDDRPFLMNLPLLNSNAVPSTTSHPEAGLLFLNWMYASKENQDLVLYGVKGEQWNAVDENTFERLTDEYNTPLYAFDAWMIEYVPYHRFDVKSTMSDYEKADFLGNVRADNTVVSVMTGFNFDTEPVKVEYANMLAEYTTSMLPIKKGVVAYEDGFDAAMEKMKAAGCEAVIAEYQKQLSDFIAQYSN
ncbi:MAG: ABC transporter substrate-binding protein, partial [Clostridiales bacterium]|nr:ABC transporter substrate-binding protein [Clostridiales bacterium]